MSWPEGVFGGTDERRERAWRVLVAAWTPVAVALGRGAEVGPIVTRGPEAARDLQEWCRSIGYELDGSRTAASAKVLRGQELAEAIEEVFGGKHE